LQALTKNMYMVALLTSFVIYGVSYLIKKNNKGFSFVPDTDEHLHLSIRKKESIILILVVILLSIGVGIVYYSYHFTIEKGNWISFLTATVVLLIETVLLVHIANKKERVEVGSND